MKIIISHDVDHINSFEHFGDMFLPKYFMRNSLEFITKCISLSEFHKRFSNVILNKFNNVEDLLTFDKKNYVKSTFFIAVNNALSLSYNLKQAKKWTNYILKQGVLVGIHGINYDSLDGIRMEKERFKKMSGLSSFGIRMHYLRNNKDTLRYLEQVGYCYDSTIYSLENPYKVASLWEFPVNLMDSSLFYGDSSYQTKSIEKIKEETINRLEKAESSKLQYFTIVTHDFYFTDAHKKWKEWYIWLIKYLQERSHEFTNFHNAIEELNCH
jgi:peptidoglycan/xylan/chitin deacetylase (PgdA/CDA1 family)